MKNEYFDIDLTTKQRDHLESLYRYREIGVEDITIYTDEDIDFMYETAHPYDEKKDLLREAIKLLTEKQRYIVLGLLEGKTQTQMAKELGINQSTISLTLSGANGHGGIIKKLRRLIEGVRCVVCGKKIDNPSNRKYCGSAECKKEAQRRYENVYRITKQNNGSF